MRSKCLLATLAFCGATFATSIGFTPVPNANPKSAGYAAPNVLPPELIQTIVAQGSFAVENPSALTGYYGYDNDGPMLPAPGAIPSATVKVEATKTEPDKNTYLVLNRQRGADPTYDYGRHFLFQGHETGLAGYITRINLDAEGAHRVTVLATTDVNGAPLPLIDGSTWYPFSERLLFTSESGASGGVWQATANYPSEVEDISGVMGRGGYEGIQADGQGRIIIVEDVGGAKGAVNSHARRPNSFLYRFIPYNRNDLKQGGVLQALQVFSDRQGTKPIVFGSLGADADIKSDDVKLIHTYGQSLTTRWVKIHDTMTDGFTPFDANKLAKAAGATPFKRPENGQFRPGSDFTEFVFDETGDTDLRTEAGAAYGGFGAVLRLFDMRGDTGKLSLVYLCDAAHSGLDNVGFWSDHEIVFVEDAGDTLHAQRNALDSAFLFDLNADYSKGDQPARILAEGRDASATLDSALGAFAGFNNEGDNEITGWHVSDGDPSVRGLLGAKEPTPFARGWRVFWTQQHGDNVTWEILPSPSQGKNN